MKSVGEAMAIGRTFRESFAKAMRSRELDSAGRPSPPTTASCSSRLEHGSPDRFDLVLEALAPRRSVEELNRPDLDRPLVPARARRRSRPTATATEGLERTYKSVDTCAAEFEARTPYYYSAARAPAIRTADSAQRSEVRRGERASVVILGSGPNRIGQGIEFDYCCVHAAMTVRESGRDAVMVNCNPETVSTDYDTSDRLYFEPLTAEDVLAVIEQEQPEGVIVQFGGQTPLRLAKTLEDAGVKLLGTPGRRDRPRRGPRPLRRAAAPARDRPPAVRHGAQRRRGAGDRRAGRLPAARPALLRARRPGDGDLLLRTRTSPTYLDRHVKAEPGAPAAARPLPRGRDRGRRRRALRRHRLRASPASCSTSRRPASTPATRPACCRR